MALDSAAYHLLSPSEVSLLLAHVLRLPEVMQRANAVGLFVDFNATAEGAHKLIFRLASEFFQQYGRPIPAEILYPQI